MSKRQLNKAKKLSDEISNNLYAIYDYCNLNSIKMIDYEKKEYPIALIEMWSDGGKKKIDELQKILEKLISNLK